MKTTYLYFIILFLGIQSVFAQDITLVAKNSAWKYYQEGNMPAGAWTTSGYSDVSWSSGNAILAWGVIDAGATITQLQATPRVETIYFRQSFNYNKTGTETKLVMNYVFDDGAVVYLNGIEIARINMPAGTPTYSTWTSAVGNESTYTLLELPPAALTALVTGANIVAVEVHNCNNTSSDLGMDCSLTVSSAAQTAACKHIRFGSSGNPLNGLTITWRNAGTADKIKWGYSASYEKGEFTGTRRTIYTDNQFDYVFPSPVTPGATIYYQLYDSQTGIWTSQKTYKTGSDESTNKFNFTALGDSRTNLADWQAVANAAVVNQSDFVMFGGDITNSGIGSEYDSWFDNAPNFIENRVFYHTIGNHEIVSDPSLVNYKGLYTMPGNEEYFSFTYGNAIFLVINSEKPSDAAQLAWLHSTLAANTGKTWKFVMFHRPFYTSPSHTGEMDPYFGTIWKAFDDYGVDIVLNGHTHNYQRTKPINRNVSTTTAVAEYGSNPGQGRCEIVAGAAGAPLSGAATAGLWWLQSTLNDHHYCNIDIDGNTLTFKAYKRDQTLFDQFTITKAAAAPVISNVQAVNTTETSATINWTTDLASSSDVEFGLTSSYGSNASVTGNVTSHSVPLTGLVSWTTYHYRVKSNGVYSADYTFTTQTQLAISDVSATNITENNASINWTTNLNASSDVEFGITTSYGSSANIAGYFTSHSVPLTGLTSGTLYHYRVKSNGIYSADYTFTTLTQLVISGVSATNITETSATINWTTNVASSSEVDYGTTTSYGFAANIAGNVINHSVPISGLASGSTFHYRVKSSGIYSDDNTFSTKYPVVNSSYSPNSITITAGTNPGSLSNLATSNNAYYILNSSKAKPFISDWYGVVSIQNISDILRFTVKYEGKYSRSVNQILYLRNFITNSWVQIDARTVSTADIPITSIQNAPANFISSGGEIWVRVYATTNSKSFTCSGDFMQIIIESQAASQSAFKSGQAESPVTPVSLEDKFRLFPNPVFDLLNIELEGIEKNELISVEILNIAGIKMKSQNIKGIKTQLNLVDLPSGIYFVKVKTSANMYLRKIIMN